MLLAAEKADDIENHTQATAQARGHIGPPSEKRDSFNFACFPSLDDISNLGKICSTVPTKLVEPHRKIYWIQNRK